LGCVRIFDENDLYQSWGVNRERRKATEGGRGEVSNKKKEEDEKRQTRVPHTLNYDKLRDKTVLFPRY